MSVEVSSVVWAHSSHSGSELVLMLAIAERADPAGWAWPSVNDLATRCRTTPRNANRLLAALRASGELEVHLNQGPRGTNRYRICLEFLTERSPLAERSSLAQPSPQAHTSSLTQRPSPDSRVTLTRRSPPPDAHVPAPLTHTSDEPSMNRQEPSRGGRRCESARTVGSTQASRAEGFESFWAIYPNRKAKQEALKAWTKLKPDLQLQASIIQAVLEQSQGADWQKEAGRYIPHAATWLNGARWFDEPNGMATDSRQLDLQGVL